MYNIQMDRHVSNYRSLSSGGVYVAYTFIVYRMLQLHYLLFILFSLALQPSAGYGLLVHEVFVITHNDAPQLVGLLWTSVQLVPETST
jgi:hypothetical protein